MAWRGDIEKHYNNASKAYDVLELIDNDELTVRECVRDVIVKETVLSCKCIIDWINDENNENSQNASVFIETLQFGYDICVLIEARTFIYKLLGQPLSEILINA